MYDEENERKKNQFIGRALVELNNSVALIQLTFAETDPERLAFLNVCTKLHMYQHNVSWN